MERHAWLNKRREADCTSQGEPMARKKSPKEADIARLKTKVSERTKASEKRDGDPALRSLRKHLKRAQRKQRALALRKAHASGKKADTKPATAAT